MPFLSVFVADLLDADDRRPVTSGPNHLFNTRLCLGTCLKTDSEPAFLTPAARFEISAHANADMCFWNLRCGNREDADFAFVVCVWVGISAKGYLEGRTWGAVSVDLQTSQSH